MGSYADTGNKSRIEALLGIDPLPEQKFDKEKLKKLIHYVCHKYKGDRNFGATKLNKIFWFADKYWFHKHQQSLTTLSYYMKRQRGPMLPGFYDLINELEKAGTVTVQIELPHSFQKKTYHCETQPDMAGISGEEIAMIDEVADAIINHYSANEISELSHDFCWCNAEMGREMPISMTLLEFSKEPTAETMKWVEAEARDIQKNY